jgi:hypothetical protein
MLTAMRDPTLLPLIRLFGRRPAPLVALGIALILGLTGSTALLAGLLNDAPLASLWRSAVQLWINALAAGYVVGIALYESRRLDVDLAELRPSLHDGPWKTDVLLFARNRYPRSLLTATLAGAAFGAMFNIETRGLLHQLLHGLPPAWEYAWGPLVLVVLWALVFHVLWVMLGHTRMLARIARQAVRFDLNRLAVFDPIANAGIRHLLLIIVGLTVIPVQAILTGTLAPMDFAPAVAVVLPAGLVLATTPIYGAHRAIVAARSAELQRLDAELEHTSGHSDRHLLLALYRYQVAATPAWPLTLRSVGRAAVYLVIPPLAWVAAALVEARLSAVL